MKHLPAPGLFERSPAPSQASTSVDYSADAIAAHVVAVCRAAVVWRGDDGTVESLRLPSEAERHHLEKRLATLKAMLTPCAHSRDGQVRAGAAIADMLTGFTSLREVDRRGLVAGLVTDLQSLPAWAIETACTRVRRAEVPGLSLDFAPSSPRLFAVVKAELEPIAAERQRIVETLALRPKHEPTEQERQRAAESAQRWLDRTDPRARSLAGDETPAETIDEMLARHGVSREAFDAIPQAPERDHAA